MTLYDFIRVADNDYDTYDDVYDAIVTVCAFDEEDEKSDEYYEKFRIGIMKFVEVVRGTADKGLLCKWSDMIERNFDLFKAFTYKHWKTWYDDDRDEFIYQWVKEIHYYIAGYVSENTYKDFVKNYMNRMV